MPDVLTSRQRSYCMSRIRGHDTLPEIRLRKALWRLGIRYRLKSSLPGRPDLVISRLNAAVFVDVCFWHSCPLHSVIPKSNSDFWKRKLSANGERDVHVAAKLSAMDGESLECGSMK